MSFNILRIASVAAVATGMTLSVAHAEEMSGGYYVGASLVGSSLSDVEFDNGRTTNISTNEAKFDTGIGALLTGGMNFGSSMRGELELGVRDFDIDGIKTGTLPGGDVRALTAMLNAAYDIEMDGAFTPYVSAGIGALYAYGDISYTTTETTPAAETNGFNGLAFAGQVGLGGAYAVSDEVDLTVGYSFLAAPTTKEANGTVKMHSISAGFKYNF